MSLADHHQGFGGQVAQCAGRNNVAVNPALPCTANGKDPLYIDYIIVNEYGIVYFNLYNKLYAPTFKKER